MLKAVIKGHNPYHPLQLSVLDFPLMLQEKWPVVGRIHPPRNMFATGVENNGTCD